MQSPVSRSWSVGAIRSLDGASASQACLLPAEHLVTHAIITGMTGSGKTGLLMVMIEEALKSGVPVLVVDVKGDLANVGLACEGLGAETIVPWVDRSQPQLARVDPLAFAQEVAEQRTRGLERWGLNQSDVVSFGRCYKSRILTPGATIAEPVNLLAALQAAPERWRDELDSARASLTAAISLILRLLDRDADPMRSREHVLLSVLAERRLSQGLSADLASLIHELDEPSIETVGAMEVDEFLSKAKRRDLASALNAMLASPSFAAWRSGSAIQPQEWFAPNQEATPLTIVSVAHLDDDARARVLGLLFEEVLSWMRTQSGTSALRALVVMDEVYGWVPPHPKDPPTKKPLVSLLKQGRAFGVGVVLATQNPMDLDYRALSNAGVWCIGRLQTDADRERVIEGLSQSDANDPQSTRNLEHCVKALSKRWFVMRDVHAGSGVALLQPRHTLSWMKGPLTAAELKRRAGGCEDLTQRHTPLARTNTNAP